MFADSNVSLGRQNQTAGTKQNKKQPTSQYMGSFSKTDPQIEPSALPLQPSGITERRLSFRRCVHVSKSGQSKQFRGKKTIFLFVPSKDLN